MPLWRRGAVELLEHGEQHECDHQPDSDLREPLIVHRGSISWAGPPGRARSPPRASSAGDFRSHKPAASGQSPRSAAVYSAVSARLRAVRHAGRSGFRPMPTRKVSADLSREAFGLIGLTIRNTSLKSFDELAVAAAVKDLADQRAVRRQVAAREIDRQLDQVGHARRVGRLDARQVGRHVGDHDVDRPAAERCLEPRPAPPSSRKSPWMNVDAFDRLEIEQVERDDGAVELAAAAPPLPAFGAKRRRTYWLQAPGAAPRSTTSWPGCSSFSASSISFSL